MARLSSFLRPLRSILVGLAALAACIAGARLLTDGLAALLDLAESPATWLRRLGVIGSLVAGHALAVRFHELRSVSELKVIPSVCGLATVWGAALISLTTLTLYASGHYEVVATRGLAGAPLVALGILAAAAVEEFVFRGVLFPAIERSAGTLPALLAISIAFGGLHLFNEGAGAMTFLSVSLLGMLWTAIFVLTRNLWACTLHHAAWNFAIFSTGLPLSGLEDWRELAPLESISRGPDLLTGGSFGPEDSILNVLVLVATVAGVLRLAAKRGRLRRGAATAPAADPRPRGGNVEDPGDRQA